MRISLAGGGTDVPPLARAIGGRVVATTLDLHVRATVAPFDPGWVRLGGTWGLADTSVFAARAASFTRRASEAPSDDVAFRLLEAVRAAVGVSDGVDISVESDLTPGTGLGGSAAAAVALLAAFHRALGVTVPREHLASTAAALERDVLGLRCGLQDQLCAAVGGVLDLDFFDDGFRVSELAPAAKLLGELSAGLLLIDTHVRRVGGDVLHADRAPDGADVCADLVAAADDTARGFRLGSLMLVLAGMRRSAGAKLRRDGPNAVPRDWRRRLAALGAVVLRPCGAGGGGHVLLWADPACHPALIQAVDPGLVRHPALAVPGVALVDL